MAIFYLDVDDEITSAAARIRSTEDVDLAIVLPAGSRIATSRINFRLLAREASARSRRLAIIAPEASTRALAASAGLPVFASVVDFESEGRADDEGREERESPTAAGRPPRDEPDAATARTVIGAAGAAAAPGAAGSAGIAAARSGAHARPIAPGGGGAPADGGATASGAGGRGGRPAQGDGGRPRGAVGASTGLGGGPTAGTTGRRRWPLVLAVLLVVGVLGATGAVAGYVLLPTATVTLQLTTEPVGPIRFSGTADPDAVAVDPVTATIPATRVAIPLAATGTFKATGTRVESSKATGEVRWTNCDPTQSYTIPGGTIVRTPAGVGFATAEAVFLPVAPPTTTPGTFRCQNRTIAIVAVRDGPAGNVPPGSITVIPGQYNSVVISVTNLKATSGGVREEFPVVAEKDVAAAVAALTEQLDAQLAEVAPDPPGVPGGFTAYAETALRGEPVPSEPAADIVGREVETFDLTLTADGSVLAADPAPLEEIGLARIGGEVPDGMMLREGSTRVEVGPGVVEGQAIRFPVVAGAEAVRNISADEVRALVRGRTPAEAEELLADYGTVEIESWPSWATTITGVDARLTVVVEGVPPAEPTASPSEASPSATPAPAESAPGSAAPGASPPAASAPPESAAPPSAAPSATPAP